MSEIFDLIKSVNRLHSKVDEINARVEFICKYPSILAFEKNIDEAAACKILKVGPYQIYKMRKTGEIEFIRYHRKILYPIESIHKFLDSQIVKTAKEDTG